MVYGKLIKSFSVIEFTKMKTMKVYQKFYDRASDVFIRVHVDYDNIYFIDEFFEIGTDVLHGQQDSRMYVEKTKVERVIERNIAGKKTIKMLKRSLEENVPPNSKTVYMRLHLFMSRDSFSS
jgi:hypothetical protein